MKKLILFITLLCISFASGFAKSSRILEIRNLSSFSGISANCEVDVYITEGDYPMAINVEANDPSAFSKIITSVEDNILTISLDESKGKFKASKMKVAIHITTNKINFIEALSKSEVQSSGTLNCGNLKLNARDKGEIKLDIKADAITCKADSGGEISLKGSGNRLEIEAANKAELNLASLKVDKVEAKISSKSTVNVYVTKELKADIDNALLTYKGGPGTVNANANNNGEIKKK